MRATGSQSVLTTSALWLTLAHGGDNLIGTFQSQVKDTAETVLLTVTGTFSAIPITV